MNSVWKIALGAALLGGCAARHEAYCRYEGPARIGQTVYVNGPSVRAGKVVEDSRCPIDVHCVQAGTVRVSATLIASSQTSTVELALGQPAPVDGGTLTLLSVQPPRRAGQSVAPEDYRFTFRFQPGK